MYNTKLECNSLNIIGKRVKFVIPFTFFSNNTKCCLLKLFVHCLTIENWRCEKNLFREAVIILVWKDEEALSILLPTYFISVITRLCLLTDYEVCILQTHNCRLFISIWLAHVGNCAVRFSFQVYKAIATVLVLIEI